MKIPFERVVEDHGATVLRVCRAVVGTVDADDAWSQTFLSALRAYPDLPKSANVQAWLVTIAHRKAVDILRQRRTVPLPFDDLLEHPGPDHMPDAVDQDVWEAVAALPLKQRQAVAYHYLAGFPYAEIADLVGGTPEAARRAASDGIRRLRSVLLAPLTPESSHAAQQ